MMAHPVYGEKAKVSRGYARGLEIAMATNPRIRISSAELKSSTGHEIIEKKYPGTVDDVGIRETYMVMEAAGLAHEGYHPHIATFSIFFLRALEPWRQDVVRPNLPVHVAVSHAGLHTGEDGKSAQAVEDLAIYRNVLKGAKRAALVCPADAPEAEQATVQLATFPGPTVQRFGRNDAPTIHNTAHNFALGKAETIREGSDVTIMAHGRMVDLAEQAAEQLHSQKISARVLNVATLVPIDRQAIYDAATDTGAIVVAADELAGGLFGAVSEEFMGKQAPPMDFVGMHSFGETGKPDELYRKYGLTAENIAQKAAALEKARGRTFDAAAMDGHKVLLNAR